MNLKNDKPSADPVEDILEKANKKVVEAEKDKEFTVVVAQLNVRSTPSMTTKNVVRVIKSGTKVRGTLQGEWIKLVDGNYVKAEFVAPVKEG